MDKVGAATSLIVVGILGWISIFRKIRELGKHQRFASEFLSTFQRLVAGGMKGDEDYTWLIHRSPKMQALMGNWGILGSYREPFGAGVHSSYPIILNMIPSIRREVRDMTFRNDAQIAQLTSTTGEAVLRYIGHLDDQMDGLRDKLKNPIMWYFEGTRMLIISPIMLLVWGGLISMPLSARIERTIVTRLITFLVAVIGLVSAVVTIVLGWPAFLQTATKWMK